MIWKAFSVQDEPKPFKKNSAGTQMYGPAGGAIWSAPTLDPKRKVIYAATGNSYTDVDTKHTDAIIALDMETGKIKWANQVTPKDNFLVGCRQAGVGNCPEEAGPDHDFGSSVILRSLPNGKQVLLCGQKSGVMYALDPDDNGKKLWEVRVGNGGALGGIEWGFAADTENVYVPVADVSAGPLTFNVSPTTILAPDCSDVIGGYEAPCTQSSTWSGKVTVSRSTFAACS